MTTAILLIILGAIAFVALLMLFISLLQVKVWIFTKTKRAANLVKVGFLSDHGFQSVPDVHLSGDPAGKAIGRIKMGEKDDNAYIEILNSDFNDDTAKPRYKTYGYITQEGLIYKKISHKKKPEIIGYTAKPSKPNEPTIFGEKSWKTLWLKCRLNVYAGHPEIKPEEVALTPEQHTPINAKAKDEKGHKPRPKAPVAFSSYTAIHSSRRDPMPSEARAGAFGLLYSLYNKQNYQEYYNSPSFGWKDTALLSAFVYSLLYVAWYIVAVKLFGVRFIGFKVWLAAPIFATYFAVWAIVRTIKVECIERSNTIQPKIDLFNKIVGQKAFDIAIIVCCIITLAFSGTYYRFNFLPLAVAMILAFAINFSIQINKKRWEVVNPLVPEDEEDDEEDEAANPTGDIERTYEWELDSIKYNNVEGKLALYFYAQYIADLRFMNPFYNQRKDKNTKALIEEMFNFLREHKSITARSRYVAQQIKRIAARQQLDEENTLQFTLDFVQEPNIRFTMNRDSDSINHYEEYIRYPDEVLYDKEADSNSKALLAAVLFHFLGHDVLFLLSRQQHHGALGIKVRKNWIDQDRIFGLKLDEATFVHNGKRYLFCETTSDGFRIGGTIYGMRFEDFEDRIELPVIAPDADEPNADTQTCLYSWDLDSAAGNNLHGSFTIEFDKDEMEALRSNNPFLNYGKDGENYEDKIRKIFQYIRQDSGRMDNVNKIAAYIKKTVEEANLPELDLVQFALDFCQAPNITYCIDEDSSGIKYAKEYMRFPDEVLYDKEGDCDCKSSLTAALLNSLGYKVVILLSEKLGHAGIGVEYKTEWGEYIPSEDKNSVFLEHNGTTYVYCETTGDGLKVGQIKDGTIHDFEKIIEIQ